MKIYKLLPSFLLVLCSGGYNEQGFKVVEATSIFADISEGVTYTEEGNDNYLITGFTDLDDNKHIRLKEKVELDGLSFDFEMKNYCSYLEDRTHLIGFYFSKEEGSSISTEREIATTQYSLWSSKVSDGTNTQDRFGIYQHVIDSFNFASGDGNFYEKKGDQYFYHNRISWNGESGFAPTQLSSKELILTHAPNNKEDYTLGLRFSFSKYSEHIYKITIRELEPHTIWEKNDNCTNDGNYSTVVTYIDDWHLPLDEEGKAYLYFYGGVKGNNKSPLPPSIKVSNLFTRNVTYNYVSNIDSIIPNTTIQINRYSLLEKPTDPTLDGYTFIGWYKDMFYKNAWDFENDVVNGNTTLYARWVANGEPIPETKIDNDESESVNDNSEITSSNDNADAKKQLSKQIYQLNWLSFIMLIVLSCLGLIALGVGIYFLTKHLIARKKREEIIKK